MSLSNLQELLEAGVHFGHQTQRWNPKMKRYIFDERNGIYIIDLRQTEPLLRRAYEFVTETVAQGGNILFVGTKRQAQECVIREAKRCEMPYVAYRWVGGTLTNFGVVRRCIERLGEIESLEQGPGWSRIPPKERLDLLRQKDKLFRLYGGLRHLKRVPAALFIVDTVREQIAAREANRLGIPVVAILDTDCDPDLVQYPIPGNDDAIRSIQLLTSRIAGAVAEGLGKRDETALMAQKGEMEQQFYVGRSLNLSRTLSADPDAIYEVDIDIEEDARREAEERRRAAEKAKAEAAAKSGEAGAEPAADSKAGTAS
jgi:small subunit ribosomal protein S2